MLKVLESIGEGVDPGASRHVVRQARDAVDSAILHVELVRELVDDDVDAVDFLAVLEPRDQHRAAFPCLAEHRVVVFMHHAILVDDAARNDEVARIDDDADPAAIMVEAEVQHGQAGLQANRKLNGRRQAQVAGACPFLFGDKCPSRGAQPLAIAGVQVAEKRQVGLGCHPLCLADLDALDGALAPPFPAGADHRGFPPFSPMPVKMRATPSA